MSANNEVAILEDLTVVERDVEHPDARYVVGKGTSLEDAVRLANNYIEEQANEGYPVEYGLNIYLREE